MPEIIVLLCGTSKSARTFSSSCIFDPFYIDQKRSFYTSRVSAPWNARTIRIWLVLGMKTLLTLLSSTVLIQRLYTLRIIRKGKELPLPSTCSLICMSSGCTIMSRLTVRSTERTKHKIRLSISRFLEHFVSKTSVVHVNVLLLNILHY